MKWDYCDAPGCNAWVDSKLCEGHRKQLGSSRIDFMSQLLSSSGLSYASWLRASGNKKGVESKREYEEGLKERKDLIFKQGREWFYKN